MTSLVIAMCMLLLKSLGLAAPVPSELKSFPDQPVSQVLSADERMMYVFIGAKSFSYNNASTSFPFNQFNGKDYLTADKAREMKRMDSLTIAAACGVRGITFVAENGVAQLVYDVNDYDPQTVCSILKVSATDYFYAYVVNTVITMEIVKSNGKSLTNLIKQTVLSVENFVTCSLLSQYNVIICLYFKTQLEQLVSAIYLTTTLSQILEFTVNQTTMRPKIISFNPNTFYVFISNYGLNCYAYEYKDLPVPSVQSMLMKEMSMPKSFNSYDIQYYQNKTDMEYKWLIILCHTNSCYLKIFDFAFNEDIYKPILIAVPGIEENKGVSLHMFSANFVSIIISQETANYALIYNFPDCTYLEKVETGMNLYSFSNIQNTLLSKLYIAFHLAEKNDAVLITAGYTLAKSDLYYPFPQINFSFKKRGSYSYDYSLVNEDKQLTLNCRLEFSICYYKCDSCLTYGNEQSMKCSTCIPGYYFSYLKQGQCISKKECVAMKGFILESKAECVASCTKLGLVIDVETSSCVSTCSESKILDQVTSGCLSKEDHDKKVAFYIDNIDKYILDVYHYYPLKITDEVKMSIYNTSILPIDPALEVILLNSYEKIYLSSVDLKLCKDLLIKENKLDKSKPLIIAKYDSTSNTGLVTHLVDFIVYSSTGKKIDLAPCLENNEEIIITSPILDKTNDKLMIARNYSLKGINVFESSDPFFNNFCYPTTSDYLTDIPLINRLEDIYIDEAILCNPGCKYVSLDYSKSLVICSCSREAAFLYSQNYTALKEELSSLWIQFNFAVVECGELVFDQQKLAGNLGSWIFIFLLIIEGINAIYFYGYGYKSMEKILINLLPNKNEAKREAKKASDMLYFKKEVYSDIIQIDEKIESQLQQELEKPEQNMNSYNTKNEIIDSKHNCGHDNNQDPKGLKSAFKRNSVSRFNNIAKEEPKDFQVVRNQMGSRSVNFNMKQKKLNKLTGDNKLIPEVAEEENESKLDINKKQKRASHVYENRKVPSILIALNQLDLHPAFKIPLDKENFTRLYWLFLQNNHPILQSFIYKSPYNTRSLHISIFFLCIALSFTFNSLFFTVDNISKSYLTKGSISFSFHFPKMIYAFLASYLIKILFDGLSSIASLLTTFSQRSKRYNRRSAINQLRIKLYMFYILKIAFFFFFWYYVSAFCAVYPNIQMTWIICSMISFIIQMLFPFILACILALGLILTTKYGIKKLIPFFTNFAEN